MCHLTTVPVVSKLPDISGQSIEFSSIAHDALAGISHHTLQNTEELQKAGQQDLVGFIIMRMRD